MHADLVWEVLRYTHRPTELGAVLCRALRDAPQLLSLAHDLERAGRFVDAVERLGAAAMPVGILGCGRRRLPRTLTASAQTGDFPVVPVYRIDPCRVVFASLCPRRAFTVIRVTLYDSEGEAIACGTPVRPTQTQITRLLRMGWDSIYRLGYCPRDLVREDAPGVISVPDHTGVWCGLRPENALRRTVHGSFEGWSGRYRTGGPGGERAYTYSQITDFRAVPRYQRSYYVIDRNGFTDVRGSDLVGTPVIDAVPLCATTRYLSRSLRSGCSLVSPRLELTSCRMSPRRLLCLAHDRYPAAMRYLECTDRVLPAL
mgnify:CR=1 FL=1